MQKLKLPSYAFSIREINGKSQIFDDIRHKWIVLTPEEWVRQHFLKFLVAEKKFPRSLMAIEKKVIINSLPQRFDLLVYDKQGNPLMIAEFKAPEVAIGQSVFDQAVRYNSALKAPYFLISNGLIHFACKVNLETRVSEYLHEIPGYQEMTGF